MIGNAIATIRDWQPTARETQLLQLLPALLAGAWLYSAYTGMQSAVDTGTATQIRLADARAKFKRMSDNNWRNDLAQQHARLEDLTMLDPTPAISLLRMRGEVSELATAAGLADIKFIEATSSSDFDVKKANARGFSKITTTIECDFDWVGLGALLDQIESNARAYLIEGIEVRNDGEKQRMRISLKALHRVAGSTS